MFDVSARSRRRLLRTVAPLANEVPKLILLVAVTVAAFLGTRTMAARERAQQVRDAEAWYSRGQQALAAQDLTGATADFRRASSQDRSNRVYAIALARVLADRGELESSARVLIALRERIPEDPDVNLQLARIEARQGEADAAVHYYRSALSSPWPDRKRPFEVRLELSQFLLDQHQPAQALPELLSALADAPEEAGVRVRLADLLLRAGEARRALDLYRNVLTRQADDPRALAGAGTAAFELGEYATALKYLRAAPAEPATADKRAVAEMVIARDPLATRLGPAERRRRAAENLAGVAERLRACVAQRAGDDTSALDASLAEVDAAAKKPPSADRDVLEEGLSISARAEQALAATCGASSLADRALVIIAAQHSDVR